MLIWGASVFLGSFLSIKDSTETNGEVWKTTKNTSITECFAATSTFAQYIFGKFFKAQLWENVHNMKKLHRKKWFSRFQLLPLPCQIFAYLLCLQHQDRWNFWHIQVFWELCFSDTWSSHKNLCCGIKVSLVLICAFSIEGCESMKKVRSFDQAEAPHLGIVQMLWAWTLVHDFNTVVTHF